MTAASKLMQLVDNLATFLKTPDVIAKYGPLGLLAVNSFDDPTTPQYPYIDIYPIREEPVGATEDGMIAEHAIATLQFVMEFGAEQYDQAVRDAFDAADALRMALNTNMCASALGVEWIRREAVEQAEPGQGESLAYVTLQGQIRAEYSIQAK